MEFEDVQGKVVSIDDPARAGRIKVEMESQDGGVYPEWVEPVTTPGWVAMPEVGETVQLSVPKGDNIVDNPNEVRYRGRVLNDANPVAEDFRENYPKRRGFRSPAGHFLVFDDDDGIVLTVGSFGDNNVGLTIDARSSSVQIYGTASVQIKSLATVTIDAPTCTILGRPVIPGGGPI